MKLESGFILQELRPYEINLKFKKIEDVINGRLGFGQSNGKDRNLDGILVQYTFTGAATEYAIEHNLGTIPVGYLTLRTSNGGVIYDGDTPDSKTTIYLKSTSAGNTVTLFIAR